MFYVYYGRLTLLGGGCGGSSQKINASEITRKNSSLKPITVPDRFLTDYSKHS